MTAADLATRLASLTAATLSLDEIVDLNDWAVNVVRDYCRARGYDAAALVREEAIRIDLGALDLEGYVHTVRLGSTFLLDRVTRRAVFTAIVTRRAAKAVAA